MLGLNLRKSRKTEDELNNEGMTLRKTGNYREAITKYDEAPETESKIRTHLEQQKGNALALLRKLC
mgnify:CR=1 FL=1